MATKPSRANAQPRSSRSARALAATAALFLLAAKPPETRTEAQHRLEAAEKSRQAQLAESAKAAKALAAAQAEAARLSTQRVQAASALRQVEGQVVYAATRLDEAETKSAEAEATLHKREADFATLLPIMLRLSRYPSETVLAVPLPPRQALEGLLVTRCLAVQLQQESAALKAQQAEAETLRRQAADQQTAYAEQRRRQTAAAAVLDRQITTTEAAMNHAAGEIRAAEEQAAAEAAEAKTLQGAIAAMDAARARAAAEAAAAAKLARSHKQAPAAAAAEAREAALTRPLHGATGPMQRPAAGPILRAWGSPAEDGPATGITIGTAPDAFVSTPCAGRVAFAAPFRSYGKLVIVECAAGLDIVLAGLGRIDAPVGRTLKAGEPLGRMPDSDPASVQSANRTRSALYLEFRRDGRPQDPTPFLNTRG